MWEIFSVSTGGDALSPTICAPAISPDQKGWQTVLKIKVLCSQWERSACTQEGASFFSLGGGGRDFIVFFLVPVVFSWWSSSLQDVPNSTSDLSQS
jgi:hypothetical protein